MLTLKEFKQARSVLSGVILNTNLIYSKSFSKAAGNHVYIKPENMQVTGAYKIRGAYYKISTLSGEDRSRGLITASAGNHAQGVAYAAQHAGVSATIVMPTTTPLVKVNNTKDYGANVILHGETFDDAAALAAKLSQEQGLTYVHPFNDPAVATGQGTISYEIFQDLPDVDVILVPIGGGGLAAGVSTLAKLLNPNVQVIGVEPTGAASMKASLEAGHVVTLERVDTIADGVAVKTPGDKIFPYIQKNIDQIITIDDSELVDAFLDVMEKHKMVVENAGLLTIAALSHLDCRGKNVVSVLSGGNMDVITVASLVQHGLINRGRVFSFSVQLPDRPGELLRVAEIVARENGNIIKLEHNQFVNINRQSGVELRVTLEAFGHAHKRAILDAMCQAGYQARECHTNQLYNQV
ncbi:threonine ammonia-lyase [Lawsonibacter celer]|uniref:threonine ammonia-lyase n=1 Tax=Lawsonibacter celer TaxID=2986526 RepID=UPI0016481DC7|nr:threonine ammonia-lyase [Lawsonibacter celer]